MSPYKKRQGKISETPNLKEIFSQYVGASIPTHIVERTNKWSTRVYKETQPTDEGFGILQKITDAAKANDLKSFSLSTPGSLSFCDATEPGRVTLHIKEENGQWVLQDECTFG